jgi:hypothetical protein
MEYAVRVQMEYADSSKILSKNVLLYAHLVEAGVNMEYAGHY